MIFKSDDLDHPRAWLRDVVQFTVDEFMADPLNMQRAMTAMTVVYQYHERLFSYLRLTGKIPAASLEGFRADLTRACPAFEIITQAAAGPSDHRLAFTNILSSGRVTKILGELLDGEGIGVHRAVIVAKPKRQLIPLLYDVMALYRRLLDQHAL